MEPQNFVIDDVMVTINSDTNKVNFRDDFTIKVCAYNGCSVCVSMALCHGQMVDFGLAEAFTSRDSSGDIDFRCKKYVGKTQYKSPKVYAKKEVFDARSADCWSLGVVLFMMVCVHRLICWLIGRCPFQCR